MASFDSFFKKDLRTKYIEVEKQFPFPIKITQPQIFQLEKCSMYFWYLFDTYVAPGRWKMLMVYTESFRWAQSLNVILRILYFHYNSDSAQHLQLI